MRKIFLFVFIFFINILNAQVDSLIKLNSSSIPINDSIIQINIQVQVLKNWYVYHNNTIDGLENIQLVSENYKSDKPIQINKNTILIYDSIFGKVQVLKDNFVISQTFLYHVKNGIGFIGYLKGNIAQNNTFYPFNILINIPSNSNNTNKNALKIESLQNPIADCGGINSKTEYSLFSIFFIGLLGGLLALLTPCVFPMLPVTISFFTKKASSKNQAIKNGLLYGGFILFFYVLGSLPFHLISEIQPEIFNNIATNEWVNIFFFIIFIIFSISFFGYFEISLPSSFANKVDSKSSLGSVTGIFFMALTLVIVSFSCTGPIIGSLLVGTITGGAWQLTSGLAGFGVALALPFTLFSIFPHWLLKLPKSGSWMDFFKKILAFIELALAIKFLSNADLVKHWGLLKRETFIIVWIIILIFLVLYLLGKIHFPHDQKVKIQLPRKCFALVVIIFIIYLFGGLFNYNKLSLLSGFPPPTNYSYFSQSGINENKRHVINDYYKAVELAKKENKHVLVDFTGWACVNCRKMEENVWSDDRISTLLKDSFIIASLYVDDKTQLPDSAKFIDYTNGQSIINTQGDKWSRFQTINFKQVSQPLYAIINYNQQLLNQPIAYTPNIDEFYNWLICGLRAK